VQIRRYEEERKRDRQIASGRGETQSGKTERKEDR